MGDPLSVTTSIIAVLQLSATLVDIACSYKDAAKTKTRILKELASSSASLGIIRNLIESEGDQEWLATTSALAAPSGPLELYAKDLKDLAMMILPPDVPLRAVISSLTWPPKRKDLDSIQAASKQGFKSFIRRLKWPLDEKKADATLQSLANQRTVFSIALENDHLFVNENMPVIDRETLTLSASCRRQFETILPKFLLLLMSFKQRR